jgi:hypothetical protein
VLVYHSETYTDRNISAFKAVVGFLEKTDKEKLGAGLEAGKSYVNEADIECDVILKQNGCPFVSCIPRGVRPKTIS